MSQQQSIKLSIKGLFTTPSELSAAPEGAMEKAQNVDSDSEGIMKPRRGLDDYGAAFGSGTDRARKIFTFGSAVLVHYGSSMAWSQGPSYPFTAYAGTFSEPGQRITAAESNKNFYFTTAAGVKKIDTLALEPKEVGVPKAIHFDLSASGTSGFLPASNSVNYRVVWGYRDQNGNLILGAPSQVQAFTAGGTACNVSITIYIPSGISASHFVQVYRSAKVGAGITPSLELALVYERAVTSAEILAGSMTGITDIADDAIRGASLYTSPSFGGSVVANDQPPLCKVIGKFKSYMMYCNTVSKYRLQFSLLGTGSTAASLQAGDKIRIGTREYTGAATEAAMQFKVVGGTGGAATTGFPSEDIRQTSLSLCKAINSDSSSPCYAFYLSDSLTTPGLILLEERGIGSASGFALWVSRSGAFSPSSLGLTQSVTLTTGTNLVTVSGSTVPAPGDTVDFSAVTAGGVATDTTYYVINSTASSYQISLTKGGSPVVISSSGTGTARLPVSAKNELALNRVYYSKSDQPESVPLLNYRDIGAADKAILIAKQLRESFIVLKEDGCYRISGEAPFNVDLIDSTQQLIGPETAVVLNNAIYALTTQGVIVITDGGAQVIDLPIENDILRLFGSAIDTIRSVGFAIPYETSRKYILYLPLTSADTYARQAIVYNTFTRVWTNYVLDKTCGILYPPSDKLIMGSAIKNGLDLERKKFDFSDYVDFWKTETLTDQDGAVLTVTGSDSIEIGDLMYQSDTVYSFVTAVDGIGTVTTLDPVVFTLGPIKVYKAIKTRIKWIVEVGPSPAISKQFSELALFYRRYFPGTAYAKFSSDVAPGVVSVPIAGDSQSGGWGLFGWGDAPWGGDNSRKPVRVAVPREHQRCSQLSIEIEHSYAFADWEIQGTAFLYTAGSHVIG